MSIKNFLAEQRALVETIDSQRLTLISEIEKQFETILKAEAVHYEQQLERLLQAKQELIKTINEQYGYGVA